MTSETENLLERLWTKLTREKRRQRRENLLNRSTERPEPSGRPGLEPARSGLKHVWVASQEGKAGRNNS